jgi:hypothetical protein
MTMIILTIIDYHLVCLGDRLHVYYPSPEYAIYLSLTIAPSVRPIGALAGDSGGPAAAGGARGVLTGQSPRGGL